MLHGELTIAQKYFFSALSDETRLTILSLLNREGGMCVNDICNAIGRDQSLVSHHMRCLRNCGFVSLEKKGKFAIYTIRNPIISDILNLSNRHVKEMSEGILRCEIVAGKRCGTGSKTKTRKRLMDLIGKSVKDRRKNADLTPIDEEVRKCILKHFAETGNPPSIHEIIGIIGASSKPVIPRAIRKLRDADLLTTGKGRITSAYPFSAEKTRHTVVFDDGHAVSALCPTDAFGIHFMLGENITVRSRCPECGQEITIVLKDGRVVSRDPAEAVEYVAVQEIGGCTAEKCCPHINLFCGRDHIEEWKAGNPRFGDGEIYSLEEVMEDGRTIFGEFLK